MGESINNNLKKGVTTLQTNTGGFKLYHTDKNFVEGWCYRYYDVRVFINR